MGMIEESDKLLKYINEYNEEVSKTIEILSKARLDKDSEITFETLETIKAYRIKTRKKIPNIQKKEKTVWKQYTLMLEMALDG